MMPPLHHAINEGLSWQQQQEQQTTGQQEQKALLKDELIVNDVSIDSWMWLTVAVYTCSASCTTASNSVHEEVVHLLNEA